jgi:hypothetical protein
MTKHFIFHILAFLCLDFYILISFQLSSLLYSSPMVLLRLSIGNYYYYYYVLEFNASLQGSDLRKVKYKYFCEWINGIMNHQWKRCRRKQTLPSWGIVLALGSILKWLCYRDQMIQYSPSPSRSSKWTFLKILHALLVFSNPNFTILKTLGDGEGELYITKFFLI